MQRLLILPLIAVSLFGSDLALLIEKAQKNERVEVYRQKMNASEQTYEAVKSSYYPRIDLGAAAHFTSPKGPMDAGELYNVNAEASLVLMDGFKRENILDEKSSLKRSSSYNLSQARKEVAMEVATHYFNLKTVEADLAALNQKREQLQEQLNRQEKFFRAKLTTEDNVERIRAAVANTDYEIASQLYSRDEVIAKLYTLTNEVVEKVDESTIMPPLYAQREEMDALKSLASQAEAVRYQAEQADSTNYPTIVLSDKYGYTEYKDDNLEAFGFERVNSQNVLMLNLSMNLWDFSAASEQRQAVMAEHNALKAELAYKQKEADADLKLAERAIERSKKLLEAALLSQRASDRTFAVIDKKYQVRVVDYVKYLDALTQKIEAQAQYNRALGALEISYARYYYYAGFDVKEYVK
ncbi:TolC family protein [Sulfurimonas sp. HSL3-7]|uniref:TolC family protein n=1 Tax=Sulfonitrofixus jiaomeiensis TaxID=3131938 RepID=UPI0031F9CDBF